MDCLEFLQKREGLSERCVGLSAKHYPCHIIDYLVTKVSETYTITYLRFDEFQGAAKKNMVSWYSLDKPVLYVGAIESADDIESLKSWRQSDGNSSCALFYVTDMMKTNFKKIGVVIDADMYIGEGHSRQLCQLYDSALSYYVTEGVRLAAPRISLDAFLGLMRYALCMQKSAWPSFVAYWIEQEVDFEGSISLFDLSQAFFQKNWQNFIILWKRAALKYSPEFWGVYWSDQLWAAQEFCKSKTNSLSSIISTPNQKKLSFWFIKQGYKKYQSKDLSEFLLLLYEYDAAVKFYQGATVALDIFFARWFAS